MEIVKYPDLTSYVKVKYTATDKDPKIFKVNSYEDLWHLNQYVDAYNDTFTKKPTIIIPNLIDAQADRRFNKNESFGLKLVCKFLNNMKANFKIFHPHNAEVVNALMNNIEIIDNSEFIKSVLHKLSTTSIPTEECKCGDTRWCKRVPREANYCKDLGLQWYKDNVKSTNDNLILMSSDAGGFKSLMKLCDKIGWHGETESAAKSRKFIDSKSILEQRIDRIDFNSKDVLLIDDILIYGGSAKGIATLLKTRNVGKIYGAFSHLTIQNFPDDSLFLLFDHIYTTNSKFDNYFIRDSEAGGKQPNNLEIIKMF